MNDSLTDRRKRTKAEHVGNRLFNNSDNFVVWTAYLGVQLELVVRFLLQ